MLFSLYLSLFWELRDKGNLKNLQFWPERLGAMLEYWFISNVAYCDKFVHELATMHATRSTVFDLQLGSSDHAYFEIARRQFLWFDFYESLIKKPLITLATNRWKYTEINKN